MSISRRGFLGFGLAAGMLAASGVAKAEQFTDPKTFVDGICGGFESPVFSTDLSKEKELSRQFLLLVKLSITSYEVGSNEAATVQQQRSIAAEMLGRVPANLEKLRADMQANHSSNATVADRLLSPERMNALNTYLTSAQALVEKSINDNGTMRYYYPEEIAKLANENVAAEFQRNYTPQPQGNSARSPSWIAPRETRFAPR